jgi:hypothetical protein
MTVSSSFLLRRAQPEPDPPNGYGIDYGETKLGAGFDMLQKRTAQIDRITTFSFMWVDVDDVGLLVH